LGKHLNTLLNNTLTLPHTFNVQNSYSLTQSLQDIEIDENTKLCSFDIENMYTNIPTTELKNMIKNTVDQNYSMSNLEKDELLNLLNLKQNYFQFKNQFYKQNDGLAMGAPTSAILAETFVQYLEHTVIYQILKKHQIIDYYRYVDDILIIYNEQHTNIHDTLEEFNNIHPNIKFTMEQESLNRINYLDLTITKEHNKLTFNIYQKPTTTDSIIPNDSCHPNEHKKSAIRYLINRMNTYPLTHTNRKHESTLINEILKNNGYQQQPTTKPPKQHKMYKVRKQNGLHLRTLAQRLK
jgi:hypothetical protein